MRRAACYTGAVDLLDFWDICAILLGIFFTIAKLDAQGRKASDFTHVSPDDFERWRDWTVRIYRLGSAMCFVRVIFHQGWSLYLSRQTATGPAAPPAMRYLALAVDLAFWATLVATFVRANRARELRRQLGIVLTPLTPQQRAALASDEDDATTKRD
jgi:hypothetical protein